MFIAPRSTTGGLASNITVATGPITVYGIFISNSGALDAEITFNNAVGTQILAITVPLTDSKEFSIPFIAEGLTVVGGLSDDIDVTVFHNSAGT